MKLIAIGDLHGLDTWKKIVEKEKPDITVFMGDYFDSFDIPARDQIENFKEVLQYKRSDPKNVVLLCGNHDYHYLPAINQHYSGYQLFHALEIRELVTNAVDKREIQMCLEFGFILFSHAGITKTWLKNILEGMEPYQRSIQTFINDLFYVSPKKFEFQRGGNIWGNNVFQSPIWVRPESLSKDFGYSGIQVVGHTQQSILKTHYTAQLIIIDTLATSQEYLIIEDDVLSVGSLSHP